MFRLLCSRDGCPVAIEVFEGNVGDASTPQTQVAKLRARFELDCVVLVGDRGMITEARITETVKPAGLDSSHLRFRDAATSAQSSSGGSPLEK